ncbi:MAG: caspase family protein [candidate division KSB1 bacterium]|nr:caspase family protein [candidate division KSB1 bacterium]
MYFGTKGNPKGKLFNVLRPDGTSDVFVFYSGHGSPDVNDQKGYFVPVDADPQYVGVSGYSLDLLYENLAQLPAKSVTAVLDACFSGSGLLENISPVRIKFTNALMAIKNGIVLSSSTGDQVSSWYPEKRHGLFTYFFLKAMHNRNADLNKDGLLTFEEVINYVADPNEGVPRYARKLHNVEQNPAMMGDKSKVFVKY